MAEFPRYQSKGQLTTQQPSIQAAEDRTGQMIEKVGQVANAANEAGIKYLGWMDTVQKTTAEANFKGGILDIETRAQNDPNYNNSEQYFKEIDKLKTNSLKGFTNENAKFQAAVDFGYQSKISQIKIDNVYKKKAIDVGQASTMELIDIEVNNPNPDSLTNIKKLLSQQVNAGIFDRKDAYQMLRKANEDLGVNRINKDLYMSETPEQVDAVIENITSGAYEKGGVTINPDNKKNLIDIADRTRNSVAKEYEKKIAIGQNKGEEDASNLILSDAPREQIYLEYENGVKNGSISEEHFNIVKKAQESTNSQESKPSELISLYAQYAKINSSSDKVKAVRDFRNEVLTKKSLLSDKHYKELLSWSGAEKVNVNSPKMNGLQKMLKMLTSETGKITKSTMELLSKYFGDGYTVGQKVSKGGRNFEVVKKDDGSLGFKEVK